mgnify:CR=1 FL=1
MKLKNILNYSTEESIEEFKKGEIDLETFELILWLIYDILQHPSKLLTDWADLDLYHKES